jgi:hypothetical protein
LQRLLGMHMYSMRLVAKNNTSVSPQTLVLPVLTPNSLLIVDRRRRSSSGQLGEFYRQLPRLVFGKQISR